MGFDPPSGISADFQHEEVIDVEATGRAGAWQQGCWILRMARRAAGDLVIHGANYGEIQWFRN